ncbi:hypothetical protein AJ78_05477 [Emergomyces pasteurianus Ep9510]|uniref:N-acetyltransferase domain-containing protein n=1 Tax=Emergomyces pasteurianus Ep9510 TaxID=1447872 RepID=A0A1J9PDQ9_9EURO|nr:hypothetical protein AJ78_05477 [Emergomyces pasteurianus Ep9510]
MATTIHVLDRDWDHPDSIMLRQAQRSELAVRYNTPDSEYGPKPSKEDITAFVVAYIGVKPVACGALRSLDKLAIYRNDDADINQQTQIEAPQSQPFITATPPLPAEGEVKRMFVLPELRGKKLGIASIILEALHERGRNRGWRKLVCETGKLQPDAVRFYMREGYKPIENYGHYVGSELSVCFEREI